MTPVLCSPVAFTLNSRTRMPRKNSKALPESRISVLSRLSEEQETVSLEAPGVCVHEPDEFVNDATAPDVEILVSS